MTTTVPTSSLTPEQQASMQEDRGPTVIAVSSLFNALCTIAVGFRFAARYLRRMGFGGDDSKVGYLWELL